MIPKAHALLALLVAGPVSADLVPRGPEIRVDTLVSENPQCAQVAYRVGVESSTVLVAWDYRTTYDFLGAPLLGARAYDPQGRALRRGQTTLRFHEGNVPTPFLEDVNSTPSGYQLVWKYAHDRSHYRSALWPNGSAASPLQQRLDRGVLTHAAYALPDGRAAGILALESSLVLAPRRGGFGEVVQRFGQPGELATVPTVRGLPGGGFVAAWSTETTPRVGALISEFLRVQTFTASAKPRGPAVLLAAATRDHFAGLPRLLWAYSKCNASVLLTVAPDGAFAVVWALVRRDGETRVFARFFDAAGRPSGPRRVITLDDTFGMPAAGALSDSGRLLLVSKAPFAARVYDASGAQATAAVAVASGSNSEPPFVAEVDAAWTGHGFAVAWTGSAALSPRAVFMRRFEER